MKQPPPGIPPATSAKWHTRRWTDALGYLRVRSLANPRWQRDIPWLVRWLRRESPPAGDPLREHYDAAIVAARRYQQLIDRGSSHTDADADAAWDEVLAPIDAVLERRHRTHLDHVRTAGASGVDIAPAAAPPETSDEADPWQTYTKGALSPGWAYPLVRDRVRQALLDAGAVVDDLSFSAPSRSLRHSGDPWVLLGVRHTSDARGGYFAPRESQSPGLWMTVGAVPSAQRAAVGVELWARWLPQACAWAAQAVHRGNAWSAGDHSWRVMIDESEVVELVED